MARWWFSFLCSSFVAGDIQRRSDAWLSGEVEVLGDVAQRTPKGALTAGSSARSPNSPRARCPTGRRRKRRRNDSVFFLQTGVDGSLQLWVGAGNGAANLQAIRAATIPPDRPTDIQVQGFAVPFRVASLQIGDGSHMFLGLSERDELRVLRNLRLRFFLLWLSLVMLGFGIVFFTTRRMLSHVRGISEAASRIGHSDLNTRVPTTRRNDEIAHLALTLNRMLDRIENSMHQLHTITDSLAHDLRSPLTAIRGKLEMSLPAVADDERAEPIVAAIEELDRLTDFLNKSLDVAEARADALRLTRSAIDLDELLKAMLDLYEPSMSEKGLRVRFASDGPVKVFADEALLHRVVANLLDNELKHLPAACAVTIELRTGEDAAILMVEDDGPGFDPKVREHLFERRVKGRNSTGHGLGLAFVDAVARAHGGTATASASEAGGARITVTLPLASGKSVHPRVVAASGVS